MGFGSVIYHCGWLEGYFTTEALHLLMKVKAAVAIGAVVVLTLAALAIGSYGISGFFSKAFDKSLGAGEQYERNITLRKFYNLTVRFQKEGSTSYLSFDDADATIILRAANGSMIKNTTGIASGRQYITVEKEEMNAIATASALSISSYADVVDQPVNFSFIGSTAYLTVTVVYKPASITGYVVDDLTGEYADGIYVYAFPDGSDPQTVEAIVQNISVDGRYVLMLSSNSTVALDVYAKGYDVAG